MIDSQIILKLLDILPQWLIQTFAIILFIGYIGKRMCKGQNKLMLRTLNRFSTKNLNKFDLIKIDLEDLSLRVDNNSKKINQLLEKDKIIESEIQEIKK